MLLEVPTHDPFASGSGVLGYMNGSTLTKPLYERVAKYGFTETVHVVFDADRVSRQEIVRRTEDLRDEVGNVDLDAHPTSTQYKECIFYHETQPPNNLTTRYAMERAKSFFPADDVHQHYMIDPTIGARSMSEIVAARQHSSAIWIRVFLACIAVAIALH